MRSVLFSLKKSINKIGLVIISAFMLINICGYSIFALDDSRIVAYTDYMIANYGSSESALQEAESEGENHNRFFIGDILDEDSNLIGYRLSTIDYNTTLEDGAQDVPLEIISQPQSVVVSWPDGTSFEVEVDRPDDVEEYRWCLFDGVNVYQLDGETASQSKLIIPSTSYMNATYYYFCDIKDVNGHWYTTEDATLECDNFSEYKRVFYLGEYALQPGDSFELSEYNIGSGRVVYDENGTDVTFENVYFSTDKILYDSIAAESQGFLWSLRRKLDDEYHINVVGDCVFENNFFDDNYLSAGVTGNVFFAVHIDDTEWPKVIFDGDGTLTFNGGLYGLYCDGDVEINCNLNYKSQENKGKQSAVNAQKGLAIGNNLKMDLDCKGVGLESNNYLTIGDNAVINIRNQAIVVKGAPWHFFSGGGIATDGEMTVGESDIDIAMFAKSEDFVDDWVITGYQGISCFNEAVFNNSDVIITIEIEDEVPGENVNGYNGRSYFDKIDVTLNDDSNMIMYVDAPSISQVAGFNITGDLNINDNSMLNVTAYGANSVFGVATNADIIVNDALLYSLAETKNVLSKQLEPEGYYTAGILAENLTINLTDCKYSVVSIANDKVNPDTPAAIALGRVSGTETEHFKLGNNVELITPEGTGVRWTDAYDRYGIRHIEELTDINDNTKPSHHIVYKGAIHEWGEWVVYEEPTVEKEGLEIRSCQICLKEQERTIDKLPKDVSYKNTAGAGQSWTKDSKTNASFTFKRSIEDETSIDHFRMVKVDNKELDLKNYSVRSGSVIVDLKADYLQTLSVGEHTLTVVFNDGEVSTKFTIKNNITPTPEPFRPIIPETGVE